MDQTLIQMQAYKSLKLLVDQQNKSDKDKTHKSIIRYKNGDPYIHQIEIKSSDNNTNDLPQSVYLTVPNNNRADSSNEDVFFDVLSTPKN